MTSPDVKVVRRSARKRTPRTEPSPPFAAAPRPSHVTRTDATAGAGADAAVIQSPKPKSPSRRRGVISQRKKAEHYENRAEAYKLGQPTRSEQPRDASGGGALCEILRQQAEKDKQREHDKALETHGLGHGSIVEGRRTSTPVKTSAQRRRKTSRAQALSASRFRTPHKDSPFGSEMSVDSSQETSQCSSVHSPTQSILSIGERVKIQSRRGSAKLCKHAVRHSPTQSILSIGERVKTRGRVSRAAPSDMSISSVKKRQESGKKKIPRTSSAIKKPPVTRQYTRRTRFQRQKKDVSMEDGSDQSEVGDSSSKVLPLVANTFNGPRTTRRRMQVTRKAPSGTTTKNRKRKTKNEGIPDLRITNHTTKKQAKKEAKEQPKKAAQSVGQHIEREVMSEQAGLVDETPRTVREKSRCPAIDELEAFYSDMVERYSYTPRPRVQELQAVTQQAPPPRAHQHLAPAQQASSSRAPPVHSTASNDGGPAQLMAQPQPLPAITKPLLTFLLFGLWSGAIGNNNRSTPAHVGMVPLMFVAPDGARTVGNELRQLHHDGLKLLHRLFGIDPNVGWSDPPTMDQEHSADLEKAYAFMVTVFHCLMFPKCPDLYFLSFLCLFDVPNVIQRNLTNLYQSLLSAPGSFRRYFSRGQEERAPEEVNASEAPEVNPVSEVNASAAESSSRSRKRRAEDDEDSERKRRHACN